MPRDLDTPAVVIAHDAWVDATSWREVIALLQGKGLSVIAAQHPLSALADDVDAVTRLLHHQPGPVVLVGHGYGGTVITQAGNHRRVAGLVYIAAYAPDIGESTADAQQNQPLAFVGRFVVDAGGFLYLRPDAMLQFLAHDLPATDGLVLAAAQQPLRVSALLDRVTDAAWQTKPSWYGVTDGDRVISPSLQLEIAGKIQATVTTLHAGHLCCLSKPKETADVIVNAVDGVRGNGPRR